MWKKTLDLTLRLGKVPLNGSINDSELMDAPAMGGVIAKDSINVPGYSLSPK